MPSEQSQSPRTETPRTLEQFAEKSSNKRPLDELPDEVLEQVREGYRGGLGAVLITRWLAQELGYGWVTVSRVEKYISRHGLIRD